MMLEVDPYNNTKSYKVLANYQLAPSRHKNSQQQSLQNFWYNCVDSMKRNCVDCNVTKINLSNLLILRAVRKKQSV